MHTYIFSASKIIPNLHDQIKYANVLFSKGKKKVPSHSDTFDQVLT